MAKIITSQLVKRTDQICAGAVEVPTNLSPTASGQETIELVERGSYYFKPDYTVDIIANTSYLKVTRNDYLTALRATRVEREGVALLGGSNVGIANFGGIGIDIGVGKGEDDDGNNPQVVQDGSPTLSANEFKQEDSVSS